MNSSLSFPTPRKYTYFLFSSMYACMLCIACISFLFSLHFPSQLCILSYPFSTTSQSIPLYHHQTNNTTNLIAMYTNSHKRRAADKVFHLIPFPFSSRFSSSAPQHKALKPSTTTAFFSHLRNHPRNT